MKRYILSLFFIILTVSAMATGGDEDKETTKKKNGLSQAQKLNARPDLPGEFILNFGLNLLRNEPSDFETGLWGSKTLNLYFAYPINLGKSSFSIHPGIGFGLEKHSFDNAVTLSEVNGVTQIDTLTDVLGTDIKVNKTNLAANYIDIPLEFRFYTNKNDISRSLMVAVGAKAGFLFSSHTKVKYEQDGDVRKVKNKESFNLARFRYGAFGRIGIGGFSLFYQQNFSALFESGKGPGDADINVTTVGITISGF